MRKLKLFALVGALVMVFSACNKDDEFSIIGKWNVDKTTLTYSLNGVPFGEPEVSTNDGWIEFKSGGTGIDDYGDEFTWTLSGNDLTITYEQETFTLKLTTKEKEKVVGEMTESYTESNITVEVKMVIELSKL